MTVLLVDPDHTYTQEIREKLKWDEMGFDRIVALSSAEEAIQYIQSSFADLVITEVDLPGADGLELIRYLNEHSPDTQCVILTHSTSFQHAKSAVRMNCMEYAVKPLSLLRLTEILARAGEKVEQRHWYERLKSYATMYVQSLEQESQKDNGDALEAASAYIEAHLSEDLSVRELAGRSYVSADHLTRLFKKKYGMTVSEYIQDKRLRLAAILLHRGEMNVSAVADSVGFGNYSYFTEQFKKYYGETPRQYQKKHRQSNA